MLGNDGLITRKALELRSSGAMRSTVGKANAHFQAVEPGVTGSLATMQRDRAMIDLKIALLRLAALMFVV